MNTTMALLLLAAVAALDCTAGAQAGQTQGLADKPLTLPLEGEMVTNPNWREKPSNEDLQRECSTSTAAPLGFISNGMGTGRTQSGAGL